MSRTQVLPGGVQESRLGTAPVRGLLISMALPMIVVSAAQTLYNVVDSVFVARLGEEALAAVTLAFPVQMMLFFIGAGTGIGMKVTIGRCLGEGKSAMANRAAGNGVLLAVVNFAFFVLLGYFGAEAFLAFQTNNRNVVDMGVVYIQICCFLSIGSVLQLTFERMLQASGRMALVMTSQMAGIAVNLLLDPILIFGLGPVPRMGVTGAAYATVIGQIFAACMACYFQTAKNREILLSPAAFVPDAAIVRKIYAIGVPMAARFLIYFCMLVGLNRLLASPSAAAAAVCGVFVKVQGMMFLPLLGISTAMEPILSYNAGIGSARRMTDAFRWCLAYSVGILFAGVLLIQAGTPQILAVWNASPAMLEIGVPALRRAALSFPAAAFCVCSVSACLALGHGFLALAISVGRQFLFLIPTMYLLSRAGGPLAAWWAFVVAEVLTSAFCALCLRHIYKRDILPAGGRR